MKTLRQHFAILQSLPHYVPAANALPVDRAGDIARSFGLTLALDCLPDYELAQGYAANPMTRADLNGNGLGLYHNAERLFYGYLYETARCSACESAEANRNDRDYD